ncbi:YihY/virulence factor BrkB family protein [Glaesserella sp.]|uniref:YihY/virulence factor BrkB family protein n=1 Tax=Glaesserella sp. TaxID=2094731 RepID=UPI0035A12F4C
MIRQVLMVLQRFPLQLHATSLTYYSLIAIVPLLAFWLGLLEFFLIDDLFHVVMHGFLDPMGKIGERVGSTLFDFVHNTHAGIARQFTLVFFFFSIFILIYKIDTTLNKLWKCTTRLDKRFYCTWSTFFIFICSCSALLFAIKSFPIAIQNALTYLFSFWILTGLFKFIPRRHIRTYSAMIGALFCLIVWFPISRLFHTLIYWNDTYSVVFHDFVGIVIMLFWINTLWILFLCGALICQVVQSKSIQQAVCFGLYFAKKNSTTLLCCFR